MGLGLLRAQLVRLTHQLTKKSVQAQPEDLQGHAFTGFYISEISVHLQHSRILDPVQKLVQFLVLTSHEPLTFSPFYPK